MHEQNPTSVHPKILLHISIQKPMINHVPRGQSKLLDLRSSVQRGGLRDAEVLRYSIVILYMDVNTGAAVCQ